jgi:hypothetical protein
MYQFKPAPGSSRVARAYVATGKTAATLGTCHI